MGIKKLFFETIIVLTLITLLVITINSWQVHRTSTQDLVELQKQYLNATFEIYKSEIIGDILIGNKNIITTLLKEITDNREVGTVLTYGDTTLRTGKYVSQAPILTYDLNLGNEQFAHIKLYSLKSLKTFDFIDTLVIPLLLEILIFVFGFLWLLRKIRWKLLNPLNDLVLSLNAGNIEKFSPNKYAVIELKQLCNTLRKMAIDLKKQAQYEAESMAAKQVAHDIRSPLAGLNLLMSHTISLPEKQRVLMRAAIQRITDIANILQNKAKQSKTNTEQKHGGESVMISSVLALLVAEKRTHLCFDTNISIDLNLGKGYDLFSNINAIEFKRMFSNLVDNSIEAFDNNKAHHIFVNIDFNESKIIINIKDDGKGIPENILKKVGTYGFTYGKEGSKSSSGSGLGVHHAIKTIEEFGGTFYIDSKVDVGTSVTVIIPRSAPPKWFVSKIQLNQIKMVVILDDDESIHHLWKEKLSEQKIRYNLDIRHFLSVSDFESFFYGKNTNSIDGILFLMDYEFIGQNINGLKLIEKFNLSGHAVLITSHHEDISVITKAIELNVGIVPKSIVSYLPLLQE